MRQSARTHVFSDSWAHRPQRGYMDHAPNYPNCYSMLPGEAQAAKGGESTETVPAAFNWFWGMVAEQAKTGYWFKVVSP